MEKYCARNFAHLHNAQEGWTFPKITAPVTDRISYDLARQNGILQMRNEPLFDSVIFSGIADAISSQLNSVRLKLEQRRRRIEEEKRKMEQIMARQREKVGPDPGTRYCRIPTVLYILWYNLQGGANVIFTQLA